MSASLLTSELGIAMNFYTVQEFLAVLLLLAVLTAIILVFAVGIVLFQEGIRRFQEGMRRAILWAKTSVVRVAGLSPKSS
jgi:uncharacterized membrane protein (DUF106 family)